MRWQILNMANIEACPDLFEPLRPIADVVSLPPDAQTLRDRIPDFDVYFATLNVRMDRAALARAGRLRAIATPSTGTDHIDLDAARERGVEIVSLREETAFLDSVTATAEMAWGLLLATVRRLPWGFDAARRGEWGRDRFRGRQISGWTLGILGYGRLGRMVAEYGKAFRMNVLACDVRDVRPAAGVTAVDFDTLLAQSDVLSVHIHLTPENRGLLGREAFARMKQGAFLVNTSRGAIVDEDALLAALESGRLGGAGLDVIHGEWRPDLENHPLIRYARERENLVITPHVGGVTFESQRAAYTFTVGKLKACLERLI